MQFYSNRISAFYLLDITQSVIWNLKVNVKKKETAHLNAKSKS